MNIPEAAFDAATKRVAAETLGAEWSRSIARIAVEAAAPFIAAQAAMTQQEYLAAPDHSLHDIIHNIHPHDIAVPGDGDRWTKETKGKDA